MIVSASARQTKGLGVWLRSATKRLMAADTLTRRLFASTAAVMAHTERRYGVGYSKPGVIKLLHRLGFEHRKPKGLPAPTWRRKRLSSRPTRVCSTVSRPTRSSISPMRSTRNSRAGAPMAGPAWAEHLAVKRGKGRQRVNLAGALCLEAGHCQIVEDVRITAETTVPMPAPPGCWMRPAAPPASAARPGLRSGRSGSRRSSANGRWR